MKKLSKAITAKSSNMVVAANAKAIGQFVPTTQPMNKG